MCQLGLYTLRHATNIDTDAIFRFFRENPHDYIAQRGDHILIQATQYNRNMFIIHNEVNEIVGVSANFDYLDGKFIEAGATRIILNGFKLQSYFHSVRAVHTYIGNYKSGYKYFTTVAAQNKTSIRNIEDAGFKAWKKPDSDLLDAKNNIVHGHLDKYQKGEIEYYYLPLKALHKHARRIFLEDDTVSLHRRSREEPERTEEITLKLNIEVLNYYRPMVKLLQRTLELD